MARDSSRASTSEVGTRPLLAVFVTTPKATRPCTEIGTEFRFVRCKPADM